MGLFDDMLAELKGPQPEATPSATQSGPLRLTVKPRERDLIVKTVLGEAANEPDEGQKAVAAVIQNRLNAGQWGDSIPKVVLARNQFEPWNTQQGRNRMYGYAPDSEPYQRAAANVDAILSGEPDPTGGATHFYAPVAQAQLGRRPPSWAQGEPTVIGGHNFYNLSEASAQAKTPQAEPASQPRRGLFDDMLSELKSGAVAPVAPSPPDIGQGKAAAVGALSGVTANFADELAGASAASGLPRVGGPLGSVVNPLVGGARLLYENTIGTPGIATEVYQRTRDQMRAEQKAAAEQYPITNTVGQIAGAVAMPGSAMLNAATFPARVGRGAAVGAAYGGLAGAGEGEGALDAAKKAGIGTAAGGVIGAAAPPALAAIEGLGRLAGRAAGNVTSTIRGAINPEGEAARRVIGSIERDVRARGVDLTPAQLDAARVTGQPVAVQEMGGETTRALSRWASNVSPEARATIERFSSARFEGQSERATDFLRRLVGGEVDMSTVRENLRSAAQTVNRPAYNAAYRHPSAQAMWDEGFEQIAQAPVVQNAIRAASITAGNRGTIEGLPRIRSPFVVDRQTGQLTLRTDEQGNRVLPNLEFWDHVKRNLDKINTPEARTLNGALKQHLDELVPPYRQARAGAAGFFDAEDAVTAGENFVHQNRNLGEAARALARMEPQERDLFRQGFAARLIDDLNNTRDRVNVFNKINATPNARSKLNMALGEDGARRVEAFVTVEQAMDRLRGALGNSTTVRQWVELGLAGTLGASGTWYQDPNQLALAGLVAGRRFVNERVARRVADMVTSNDPAVLARGVQAVQNSRQLLEGFRRIDARLAAGGSSQGQLAGQAVQRAVSERNDSEQGRR